MDDDWETALAELLARHGVVTVFDPDKLAAEVLDLAAGYTGPLRPVLTAEQRKEALDRFVDGSEVCVYCAGLHAGFSTPACPRIATFRCDPDGKITEGSFWREGRWDSTLVILASDIGDEEG